MSHPLEGLITRIDIEKVAETEQLIFDDKRMSILQAMRSIDVQACPGSGKTTLIAAKLILLAKKWRIQHQGICVLSHTNVAKNEIVGRLKRSKILEAQRLLKYPHFIGTIQEFVHRFLALPYIRSKGIRGITVDNDEYAKQAVKLLELGQFGWLSGTLNGLGNSDAQESFLKGTFRYISQDGEGIHISKKPKAWKKEDNLKKAEDALVTLKKYLDERGFFLFRDMYTHAHVACVNNVDLADALRKRFPCILLDEMQDTQKYQDELLCKIFPFDDGKLIVQRFGDPDQAIFHGIGNEEPNQSFNDKPRKNMAFVVQKSHRFDSNLADKIRNLSLKKIPLETELSTDVLADRAKKYASKNCFDHTVIVFNDNTRNQVIESFAQIVSEQFSTKSKQSKNFTVKVVGAVGKEIDPSKIDKQLRIGHYWLGYDKTKSKTNYQAPNLIEAVRHCRRSSSIDWSDQYKLLIDCLLKLMRLAGRKDESDRYFSAFTLRNSLEQGECWESFRKGIYYMLSDACATERNTWCGVTRRLAELLELGNIPDDAVEYMAFTEEISRIEVEKDNKQPESNTLTSLENNKAKHPDGFQIEFSTIHGVKGETHDATLLVETKNNVFDLEAMLPYLFRELPSAEHPNSKLPPKPHWKRSFKPNKVFMRQFYVAMTRPRHLLCLALHSDHIDDACKMLLDDQGWKVEDVSNLFEIDHKS